MKKCCNFFFVFFLPFVTCCLETSAVLHLDESLFTEIHNKSSTVLQIKELHLLLSKDINFYSIERWQRSRLILAAMELSNSQAINSITTGSENLLEQKQCTKCGTELATCAPYSHTTSLEKRHNVFLNGNSFIMEFFTEWDLVVQMVRCLHKSWPGQLALLITKAGRHASLERTVPSPWQLNINKVISHHYFII